MKAGTARLGRSTLAVLTVVSMVMSLVVLFAETAQADHIPDTGPLPGNCVNFQAGETGTDSPDDYPAVDITLDSWADTPGDPHTVNFTISGLESGQFVDISVKSGTTEQEVGPYGNGSHSYSNGLQNAISHVRLCVFEEEPPSGWACIDGEVEFLEDASEYEGTLYDTEEEAANDPACVDEEPPTYDCDTETGEVVEVLPGDEGYPGEYESEEAAANDPACVDEEPPTYDCDTETGEVVEVLPGDEGYPGEYETPQEAADDPDCIEVQASVLVTVSGTCVVVNGAGQGQLTVTMSVPGAATVTIEGVGVFTDDATVSVAAGASYAWDAEPNEGFVFPVGAETSGTIVIEDCTPDEVLASIVVTVGGTCELEGDDGVGVIDVTVSVAGGATVVVRNSGGTVAGTFTADGSVEVPEGATYTWQATPSEGFEFPSGAATSGSITIETCSNPETLPFTGPENLWMAPLAALLMAAGAFLLRGSKRFGEEA